MSRPVLLIAILLAACSPSRSAREIEAANVEEIGRFGSSAAAGAVGTYLAGDGSKLSYLGYPETSTKRRCALVFLGPLDGHAGWLDPAARSLRSRGCAVYCPDRRGSGRSRGLPTGSEGLDRTLIADLRPFVTALHESYRHVFLGGFSWGGRLALAYALAHPQDLDGLVLVAPDIFRAAPEEGELPFDPAALTAEPDRQAELASDPLRSTRLAPGFAEASEKLGRAARQALEKVELPTLLLLAGADEVIDNEATLRLFEASRLPLSTFRYDGVLHGIPLDAPERMATDTRRWMKSLRRR